MNDSAKTDLGFVKYPVMESFSTLQGEGYYSGTASFFIRLAGCDVGCVWCDVKESWTASEDQYRTCEQITELTNGFLGKTVVITGGEPAMYNLEPLIDALHQKGFRVHIETSGAYPVKGKPDWITLSPKKFKKALAEVLQSANELKVVVFNKSDLEWAEDNAGKTGKDCLLYLQPEHSRHTEMSELIVPYIIQNPQWRLSLQTHKFIGIP
jgi:7-carboxy-7-deazaguanine synthase